MKIMGTHSTESSNRPKISYTVIIANVFFLVLILALIFGFKEEQEVVNLLLHIKLRWILLAIILQIGTYLFSGSAWEITLRQFAVRLTLIDLTALGIEKVFLEQTVPTLGIGGNLMVVRSLMRRNIDHDKAFMAMLVNALSYLTAYFLLFSLAAAVLWLQGGFNPIIRYLTLAVFLVLLCPISIILYLFARGSSIVVPAWINRFSFTHEFVETLRETPLQTRAIRKAWVWSFLFEVCVFTLDIATLWTVFRALGITLSAGQVLVSFMFGVCSLNCFNNPWWAWVLRRWRNTCTQYLRCFRWSCCNRCTFLSSLHLLDSNATGIFSIPL